VPHIPELPCSEQSISKWEQQNVLGGKKKELGDGMGEITYGKVVALKLC